MPTVKGRIIKSTGKEYCVELSDGNIVNAIIKGNFRTKEFKSTNPVAIGDYVIIKYEHLKDTAFILNVVERKNFIIRKSTKLSKLYQILAANIDQVFFIVTLTNPKTYTNFIDRFLATAQAYRVPVILIFNKIDLYTNKTLKDELFFLKSVYEPIGYRVVEISLKNNINLEQIHTLTKDKVTLLTGHSGTGKSSMVKYLIPEKEVGIGKLSKYHQKGQCTTTAAQMYFLAKGSYIVDTPGIKGFGLFDFKKEEISHFFPEIFMLSKNCEYSNCTHTHEIKCAVKDALERGEISYTRYQSYIDIFFDKNEKYRQPY